MPLFMMSNTYVRRSTRSAQRIERGERRISPALQDERCKERGRRVGEVERVRRRRAAPGDVDAVAARADERHAYLRQQRRRSKPGGDDDLVRADVPQRVDALVLANLGSRLAQRPRKPGG